MVHEGAYVDEPCTIGKGTRIWHFVHILKNTVIGGPSVDCVGTVSTEGDNYIDDSGGGSTCAIPVQDTVSLTSLANNGSNMQTNAPNPGSPLVDSVLDCSTHGGTAVNVDEVGTSRPQNWSGMTVSSCDIGAYELPEGAGG